MARPRQLSKAPITEALIDIRVQGVHAPGQASLDTLRSELRDSYPEAEELREFQASFGVREGAANQPEAMDLGLQGLLFKSEDGLQIAQFGRKGFTFNRLKPYTSWDDMLTEALRLWELYLRVFEPEVSTRIAVRYINHLSFSASGFEFGKYLTAPPAVPADMPPQVSNFFTSVLVSGPETGRSVRVTQSLEKSLEPQSVVLLLDIDAYRIGELRCAAEQIQEELEALRDLKNRSFFGSLTDVALEQFA